LLIRSWTSNKEVLPTSAKAKIKFKDRDDNELPDDSVKYENFGVSRQSTQKEMSIGESNTFKCEDVLTQIEFTIQ